MIRRVVTPTTKPSGFEQDIFKEKDRTGEQSDPDDEAFGL